MSYDNFLASMFAKQQAVSDLNKARDTYNTKASKGIGLEEAAQAEPVRRSEKDTDHLTAFVCPCGDDGRSPPSGSQECPIDLDGGNLGPTLMFEVSSRAMQSRLAPPVALFTSYEDHACLYRTKGTTQNQSSHEDTA